MDWRQEATHIALAACRLLPVVTIAFVGEFSRHSTHESHIVYHPPWFSLIYQYTITMSSALLLAQLCADFTGPSLYMSYLVQMLLVCRAFLAGTEMAYRARYSRYWCGNGPRRMGQAPMAWPVVAINAYAQHEDAVAG
jgi:hypothetical protein